MGFNIYGALKKWHECKNLIGTPNDYGKGQPKANQFYYIYSFVWLPYYLHNYLLNVNVTDVLEIVFHLKQTAIFDLICNLQSSNHRHVLVLLKPTLFTS